jgi:hypothetical protein
MINKVDAYLNQLRIEMADCDRATLQDALSDAEEYLRNAVETARVSQPGVTDETIFPSIIEEYGSPSEIAEAYKKIERRISPPSFADPTQPRHSFLRRFFGIVTDFKAWGAILYHLDRNRDIAFIGTPGTGDRCSCRGSVYPLNTRSGPPGRPPGGSVIGNTHAAPSCIFTQKPEPVVQIYFFDFRPLYLVFYGLSHADAAPGHHLFYGRSRNDSGIGSPGCFTCTGIWFRLSDLC